MPGSEARTRSNSGTDALDRVLPRLALAYQSGRLVPFLGAGMSSPVCSSWSTLVEKLEVAAAGVGGGRGVAPAVPEGVRDSDSWVHRAGRAVRVLKAAGEETFREALQAALFGAEKRPLPAATDCLARIWWPLVLTTNYDGVFAAAFNRWLGQHERYLEIRGRSSADCQAILHSLRSPRRTLLWALQGYLGGPADWTPLQTSGSLIEELVVGHDEYRRVTHRDPAFRRCFAEVFRNRSFLFLGSGLKEHYFQDLFHEVIETFGPCAHPHYALVRKGTVDPEFLLARLQIMVIEYESHEALPGWLDRLRLCIHGQARCATAWTFGSVNRTAKNEERTQVPVLEVRREELPPLPVPGECLAVSVGGRQGQFVPSSGVRAGVLIHWLGPDFERSQPKLDLGEYLRCYLERQVYLVRARGPSDTRALRFIREACRALFDDIQREQRFRRVHLQLLAAGGSEGNEVPEYNRRSFSERYAFIQIVRTFAAWHREGSREVQLVLHVIDPQVTMEVASGRLDVLELLTCPDIRFWAEILEHGAAAERRLFQEDDTAQLGEIAARLDLPVEGWVYRVFPKPHLDSPLLTEDDLRDPASFLAKLRQPPDPVSAFLAARLPADVLADASPRDGSDGVSRPPLSALVAALNALMEKSEVWPDPPTDSMSPANGAPPPGNSSDRPRQRADLRRLSLEEAYPLELQRRDGLCPLHRDRTLTLERIGLVPGGKLIFSRANAGTNRRGG